MSCKVIGMYIGLVVGLAAGIAAVIMAGVATGPMGLLAAPMGVIIVATVATIVGFLAGGVVGQVIKLAKKGERKPIALLENKTPTV